MTEGALVLEGGSLRSMFTSGVLDLFLEEGILSVLCQWGIRRSHVCSELPCRSEGAAASDEPRVSS